FAYHHLFTTVIVAISTSAYVSALHSRLHFFHRARSTCHHHLLETPSSREKNPLAGCPHINLHATITETNTTFPPPVGSTPSKKDNNHQTTFHHHPSQTTTTPSRPPFLFLSTP
ncbi:hypothetical protein Dimus_026122, partial [Dionaea muscipula]